MEKTPICHARTTNVCALQHIPITPLSLCMTQPARLMSFSSVSLQVNTLAHIQTWWGHQILNINSHKCSAVSSTNNTNHQWVKVQYKPLLG